MGKKRVDLSEIQEKISEVFGGINEKIASATGTSDNEGNVVIPSGETVRNNPEKALNDDKHLIHSGDMKNSTLADLPDSLKKDVDEVNKKNGFAVIQNLLKPQKRGDKPVGSSSSTTDRVIKEKVSETKNKEGSFGGENVVFESLTDVIPETNFSKEKAASLISEVLEKTNHLFSKEKAASKEELILGAKESLLFKTASALNGAISRINEMELEKTKEKFATYLSVEGGIEKEEAMNFINNAYEKFSDENSIKIACQERVKAIKLGQFGEEAFTKEASNGNNELEEIEREMASFVNNK